MSQFYDYQGFCRYYLNTSKYERKNELLNSFYWTWCNMLGTIDGLGHFPTWGRVEYLFKENKKAIKIKLISQGYTSQSIDALYRSFNSWLKANK